MSFGSRLRERRTSLGMSRAQLAGRLGITASAISNYENGISSPKADILYNVFDALNCDANFLFQDEMSESTPDLQDMRRQDLMDAFDRLNDEGQEKLIDYADDLVRSGKYIKSHAVKMG